MSSEENLIWRLENYLAENFIEPEPLPEGVKFSIDRHVNVQFGRFENISIKDDI